MMPLWAHGLMTKSFAYKDTKLALEAIKNYKEMEMPLQSLILPLDYFNEHFTPDATVVTAIRLQYPKA
jgi:alpha-glucosidase (family GH31 glycosyl hydrolase)